MFSPIRGIKLRGSNPLGFARVLCRVLKPMLILQRESGCVLLGDFEQRYIKPIVNASYPATLAGLDLAVLQFSTSPGKVLSLTFLLGATSFILAAFSIFSYTLYPTRRKMCTSSAMAFILGLFFSVLAILVLVIRVFYCGFLLLPGEAGTC